MPALAKVASEKLQELTRQQRKRALRTFTRRAEASVCCAEQSYISFSCNDYLGLAHHPEVIRAAQDAAALYGAGAAASRLVTGNHPLFSALEEKIAVWRGQEAALIFGSGYLANVGVIAALADRHDLIIADRLVHACMIDGARLSGAKLLKFAHNDAEDCARLLSQWRPQYRHCLLLTEEVFSMDGDKAPMKALAALAREHDAWLISDAAHSLMPPSTYPDVVLGTLSKALAGYGGYVAAERNVIEYLATSARSIMFSTGLPPMVVAAAHAALEVLLRQPELINRPYEHACIFTNAMHLPPAESHIVPVILGSESRALSAAAALEAEGFIVSAIRPPTVPEGTSRLRLVFSAQHCEQDILALVRAMKICIA